MALQFSHTLQYRDLMSIINLSNEKDFEELVLNSNMPVLVIFSAAWCGPCKIFKETIKEIIADLKEVKKDTAVKFVIIDVDDCPEISRNYNIRSIPSTVVFQNKEIKENLNGAISKFTLLQLLNKYI